ncbi:MAG: cytochrome P450 [Myxococcota bacterium]|jgi:cytochrome P450|nr:cytochrome P450 [Myxococcota bacterium]
MSAAAESLDFRLDSEELKKNPWELLRRLRKEDPVHYVESMDLWLVTRYDDIYELFNDPRVTGDRRVWEHYQRPKEGSFFRWVDDYGLMAVDRQTQAKQRHLIGGGLTPRGVRGIDQKIHDVVQHFAKPLHGRTGVVDIMKEFTTPIPVVVVGHITGVTAPGVDDAKFSQLAQEVIRGFFTFVNDEVRERADRNYELLSAWVRETIEARRREPKDDLISYLLAAQEGDFKLDDDGIVAQVSAMLAAGTETTSSGGMLCLTTLLDHPETLERVRADRSLVPQTVLEVLRYAFGGLGGTQRYALDDFEYHGRKITRGKAMMLSGGGASHDPAVYDDPDTFDIDRDNSNLLTFGRGQHYCLGANLAKAELGAIVDAALDFLPPGAKVLRDQAETESLGIFNRNKTCPVDFGDGS